MDNLNYIMKNGDMYLIETLIQYGIITPNDVIETLIKNGDPSDIYYYTEYLYIYPEDRLVEAIIATKDAKYIYLFAKDLILDARVIKLAYGVIATKDAEYIYKFAKDVSKAPIDTLEDAIIVSNNSEYIYKFARAVKKAPINELANAIITTKNAEYIYKFAKDVASAPIDRLTDAIIETKDAEYIYQFARKVPNAPLGKLIKALKDLQRYDYLLQYIDIANIEITEIIVDIIITTNNFALLKKLKRSLEIRIKDLKSKDYLTDKDKNLIQAIEPINNKIDAAVTNIISTTDVLKLDYLIKLYRRNKYEIIASRKEEFRSLFEPPKEEKLIRERKEILKEKQ